ncbi:MAG: glycosyltransferase family 4 protein [Chthoniobacteraceae bacterium]
MKPRVAMLAYACDPEGSGEHWLGWGWAAEAARRFDVQLITTPKSRGAIERHAAPAGITPHFVEPPATRAFGAWWRKYAWQKIAARRVVELHAMEKIAVVHQTTFHTFRVPFSAASLGIPSVWGPIAGGERVPPGFDRWLGAARSSERRRALLNRACLALPAVRRSLRDASAIFVSNRTTLDFLPASCHARCEIVAPNALRDEPAPRPPAQDRGGLALLYAGNCVGTRSIPLVLAALKRLADPSCMLTVVGDGPALAEWRADAAGANVRFAGRVAREDLPRYYAEADALVFPALRDSGGSALLEAMTLGLPVVCLDWAGPAEMVDVDSGVKISVADPERSIADMATAFARLRDEPAWRRSLASAAIERARTLFTWEAKRRVLEATYRRLIR